MFLVFLIILTIFLFYYTYDKEGYQPSNRQYILDNLNESCYSTTDPISGNNFEDLSDSELEEIVLIGTGPKRHCFQKYTIKEWLQRGNTTNPMSRQQISQQQIDNILGIEREEDSADEGENGFGDTNWQF